MAEKQLSAFRFVSQKRYFPVFTGVSEDLAPAVFPFSPVQK
jgi:hypothetical protein